MTSLRLDRVEVGVGASFRLGPMQLDLGPGEYLGILGPSGSGKSTLLRAIAGLAPLAAGSIRLGETVLEGPGERLAPEKRRVGMVFQSLALWPHLSAQEHLQLVLDASPVPREQRPARAAEILEKMRIAHRKDRKPPELSGGEAQRLALARALAGEPRILLLDEPLGQLDPLLRQELAEELRRIHGEAGIPVLHVTHDPAELAGLAHRVALLNEGRIEQIGTWRDLLDSPATPFVARFLDPMRRLLEIVQAPGDRKK